MRTLQFLLLCSLVTVLAACKDPSASDSATMGASDSPSLPSLRGEVFYLDRRALSDRAELILELAEIDGPVQQSLSIALQGQQVPVAFEMPLSEDTEPATRLRLRAAIVEPGGAVRLGATEQPFSFSESPDIGTLRLAFLGDEDTDAAYACGERQVRTLSIGGRLVLMIDEVVALLDQQPAASGLRFQDKQIDFWMHQDGRVRLLLDGEEQPECRRLEPAAAALALAGTRWVLTEILGEAPVPDSDPMIEFSDEEPRLSGQVGCNRFGGEVISEGQSLRFGPLMTTLMACPDEAIDEQERRALEALEGVDRYELTSDSELRLIAGEEIVLRARQQTD